MRPISTTERGTRECPLGYFKPISGKLFREISPRFMRGDVEHEEREAFLYLARIAQVVMEYLKLASRKHARDRRQNSDGEKNSAATESSLRRGISF